MIKVYFIIGCNFADGQRRMKPKSTKRKKLAEASPEPGVVLVKQTKEYKEKRGKKENTKTKTTKKKKTNVKKSKGYKEKKAKTKFGIGGSSKGKKIVKKHGKEKKKPSKNVEQIRPQKPRELPAQPLKIEGSSKKSLSKQRKIKKPLVNEKDRKPETHTERKKRREKKGLKEERKTTMYASSID
ncbi:hypothetical protein DICVIV_03917 [Dictyocaulus viviparus]|uniref:Uncharacterized protein n=1 Tax=Dictyocaulus viviparus TaxID=29172 RepID=A0A0D8XZT3_DICVI|nr:hypothetical protein DICVIV_03917 [Dictyocaulus viviparus]